MLRKLFLGLLCLAALPSHAEDVTGQPGRMLVVLNASYPYQVPVQNMNTAQRALVLLTGGPFKQEVLGLMQQLRLQNTSLAISCRSQATRVVLKKALKSVDPQTYKGSNLILRDSQECGKGLLEAADKAGVSYIRT